MGEASDRPATQIYPLFRLHLTILRKNPDGSRVIARGVNLLMPETWRKIPSSTSIIDAFPWAPYRARCGYARLEK